LLPFPELEAMSNCTACTKGWYCDAPGLLQPRAPCDPGYLCYGGAKESAPTDGVSGDLCTAGGYCPLGEFKDRVKAMLTPSKDWQRWLIITDMTDGI